MQQTPFSVWLRVEATGIPGKWLTGSAADKYANMMLGVVTPERLAVEFADTLSNELYPLIIMLVSMSAGVVGIIACDYRDSSVKQASGKPACSAEQINRFRHQRATTSFISSGMRRHAIGPYLCSKAETILCNG
jgi:hypothetical protein